MRALDRKLLRNLWEMKGQALAIALVMACGVATYVMSVSTLDSLRLTRGTYYRDYRFAEVFASLKRAPERLKERIREIPGVELVETRVIAAANLNIEGFPEPVTGRLVSIPDLDPDSGPDSGGPVLNRLYLREGRMVEPFRDEVVVSEGFAKAHGFRPGDKIRAVIKGRLKALTIVGIALSPEFIYQVAPGALFPDYARFGILWMGRKPLGSAYDMEGAFNNVVLTLSDGGRIEDVIDRLDELLEPYGGLGAYGRKDQLSYRFLTEEFRQLANMATLIPAIFLGVAAFLLNVVINRLISIQREEMATLKAFGYRNMDIGLHYVKLVMMVVLIGVAGGLAVGIWMGKGLSNMYMEFYRFPFLVYELRPRVAVVAALVSAVAALAGTVHAVSRAAVFPPAVAMRPEPPARYRETLIERVGFKRLISQPTRMIARHIERHPVKAALSVTGIAMAIAIVLLGTFFKDAVDYEVRVEFGLSRREDIMVTFVEPTSKKALYSLQSLPGVQYGEVYRSVPARFRFEHRSYRTSIRGVEPGGDLYRLLDTRLEPIALPPEGIVLTDYLGDLLGVRPGDMLTVEVLEGGRPVRQVPVAALASQYIGVSGYMELSALNRLMREGDAVSGVLLAVDGHRQGGIYSALRGMPRVASTVVRKQAIESFYETMAKQLTIFTFFITLFATAIAFGVVYNSARVALSELSRELGSLRVLGFTRGEVAYILLGELGVLTLAAIPLGFVLGRAICGYLISQVQNELYRIPLIINPSSYAFAAAVVLASTVISGLIVKHKLDRLDIIAVLKTKE